SHGRVAEDMEQRAASDLGRALIVAGERHLVAVEAKLRRADEHFDVPAVALIAHSERDERRELERAHRADARPALAVHRIDEAQCKLLADAALARLDPEHELDAALA